MFLAQLKKIQNNKNFYNCESIFYKIKRKIKDKEGKKNGYRMTYQYCKQ